MSYDMYFTNANIVRKTCTRCRNLCTRKIGNIPTRAFVQIYKTPT